MDTMTEARTTELSAENMKALRAAARDESNETSYYLSAITRRGYPTRNPGFPDESAREFDADERRSWIRISCEQTMPEGTTPDRVNTQLILPAIERVEAHEPHNEMLRSWSNPIAYRLYAGRPQYKFSEGNLMRSLANIARTGDQLIIRWLLGNDSENMRKNGLTHDECFVAIRRNDKFLCEFYVDDTVAPIGSLALMTSTTHIGTVEA